MKGTRFSPSWNSLFAVFRQDPRLVHFLRLKNNDFKNTLLPKGCSIYCKTIRNRERIPSEGIAKVNKINKVLLRTSLGIIGRIDIYNMFGEEHLTFSIAAKVVPKHFCRGFHDFHAGHVEFSFVSFRDIKPFQRGLEVPTFEGFKSSTFCHDEEFQGQGQAAFCGWADGWQMDFGWVVVVKKYENSRLYHY